MTESPRKTIFSQITAIVNLCFEVIYIAIILIFALLQEIFKLIYTEKKSVRGKLALVTGGGRGMGRSVALKLSKLGCRIAVVDIDESTAKSVAEEIKAQGGDAISFKADISKLESIKALRDDVASRMGLVDLLINNAGLIPDMSVKEQAPGFDETMVRVNVLGSYWVKL